MSSTTLRGDNAMHYALVLSEHIDAIRSPIDQAVIRGLIDCLRGCDARPSEIP